MKKIISMLLTFVMLLSVMPVTALATDYDVTIKVDTTNTDTVDYTAIQPGTVLKIPVNITANDGVTAFTLEAEYDTNVFEMIDGTDRFTTATSGDTNCTNYAITYAAQAGENIVYNGGTAVQTSTGVFANINLKVKDNAPVGTYSISLKVTEPAANNFLYYDSTNNAQVAITPTLTAGEITVKYETTGLSFVNGTQTMTYDEAKAEAEGTGSVSLTAPDGCYFVGWFSDLSIEATNGYYVIDPGTTTSLSGTEFRPRYDTPPSEGTYYALWIKGDGSYVVNVYDSTSTLEVVVADTDYEALSTAITNAAGTGRTKLVKDMTLSSVITTSDAMNLDMNGCTITAETGKIFTVGADGNKAESSRSGGSFAGGQSNIFYPSQTTVELVTTYHGGQFDMLRDISFVGSSSHSAIDIKNGSIIKNCTFTGYIMLEGSGTTNIDNCEINSFSYVLYQNSSEGVAIVTNSAMTTSTGTAPFNGVLIAGGGTIRLGAGNKVTAPSAASLFRFLETAEFTSVDSIYQIASTGVVAIDTNTVTGPDGKGFAIDSDGYVVFGTPCTVTYMADSALVETKTSVVGERADLTVTYEYGGKNYKLAGWTNVKDGTEPLTELTLTDDTTLYAIKGRKGIMFGNLTTEHESGDVTRYGSNTTTAWTIYNADRLDELDSLTLCAKSGTNAKLVFTAEALDKIASQMSDSGIMDMSVVLYWTTSDITDGAASQVQIALTYGGNDLSIPEGVQVQLYTNQKTSSIGTNKKFVVYNIDTPDTLIESETVSGYYSYFDLPANGTYETKVLDGAYLTESQCTGSQTVTLKNGDELLVENASLLANMTSLRITDGYHDMTFSAAALASIAAKAETSGVYIKLVELSTDAVAAVELTVTDENEDAVDFEGAVKVRIFTSKYDSSKNYRVYHVADDGTATGLGTSIVQYPDIPVDIFKYFVFTTTHFSTYEVRETTVAEGYTAGLYVTEDSVRAGGNTVNVTIDVTHNDSTADANDTTFNAAEIVVGYDPALLTPVTTGLTEGTYKVDETAGTLTIEVYGDAKNLGTAFNLQFKTCDSVTTDTDTTVTLSSAAFADSVDARSENLITATLDPASDTVTIQLEAFNVVYDEEVVTEGATTAVKNTEYSFTVEYPNYYDYSGLKVYVGEDDNKTDITAHVTNDGNGTYTIPAQYVTGNIIIEDNRVANKYDVTINYTGDDADESQTTTDGATYGENYTFTIPTATGYNYTVTKVEIGSSEYKDYSITEGVLTITGTAITGDIVITIEKDDTLFSVTVEGNGAGDATWTESGNDNSVDKGDTVTLTVTPATGYKDYKVTATMADVDVTESLTVDSTNTTYTTYALANVDGDIVFTVTKEVQGTMEITEYLTLDADKTEDETDTSKTMFLVRYTDTSASGSYIPTCNGEAMYWSSNYNAYCYLIISDTLENAKAATTVTAGATTDGDGSAISNPTITYSINVNCSSDTAGDAADAQLVYDMYQAEYWDFNTVGMLKFLLADVNNSKTITTEDAAYIINKILNPTTIA